MQPFPTLIPSSAPLTAGTVATVTHRSLEGGASTITTSTIERDRILPLQFRLTDSQLALLDAHYAIHLTTLSFPFNSATVPGFYTPAGYAWRYASAPTVGDLHPNVRDVSIEFVCVPVEISSTQPIVMEGTSTMELALMLIMEGTSTMVDSILMAGTSEMAGPYLVHWFPPIEGTSTSVWGGIQYPDTGPSTLSLLLRFDGTNGSQTIIDSSPAAQTISVVWSGEGGGTGPGSITTTDAVFGQSFETVSSSSPGAPSYLEIPPSNLYQFDGPFLIRFWLKQFNYFGGYDTILGIGRWYSGGIQITSGSSENFKVDVGSAELPAVSNNYTLTANQWHYIVLTRLPSNQIYLAIDGTVVAEAGVAGTVGADPGSAAPDQRRVRVGMNTDNLFRPMRARIAEFLVIKNGFTTDFSVPTGPYTP
jgi:hypothetical protein